MPHKARGKVKNNYYHSIILVSKFFFVAFLQDTISPTDPEKRFVSDTTSGPMVDTLGPMVDTLGQLTAKGPVTTPGPTEWEKELHKLSMHFVKANEQDMKQRIHTILFKDTIQCTTGTNLMSDSTQITDKFSVKHLTTEIINSFSSFWKTKSILFGERLRKLLSPDDKIPPKNDSS